MDTNLILQFLLAISLWSLIWMERGIKYKSNVIKEEPNTKEKITSLLKKKNIKNDNLFSFWEIRTFWLVSLLWAMSAWVSMIFQNPLVFVVILFTFGILIAVYYFYSVFKENQLGLTTELSVFITYFLWAFVIFWYWKVAIILTIIISFILSLKTTLESLTQKISREDLNNTLKLAVISIAALPILPDQKFSIADWFNILWYTNEITSKILTVDFFNPYWIWFFVVLIALISYAWYILTKLIWEKSSIVLLWAIWWLVSSTAVTASMSEASKKDPKNVDLYVVSTLMASLIMFVRVVLIVLFFNINMVNSIIYPSAFMLLWMLFYVWYFYFKSIKNNVVIVEDIWLEKKEYKSPFSLIPALKFWTFVLFVKFISAVWILYQNELGNYAFYFLWVISGLADVDAIAQTMADDSSIINGVAWKIPLAIASMTVIIAVMSNNIVKW